MAQIWAIPKNWKRPLPLHLWVLQVLSYHYSHADVCKILLIQLLFSSTCKWYGKIENRKLIVLLLKLCKFCHFQGRGCVCLWSNISFLQSLKEGVCACVALKERDWEHIEPNLKKKKILNPPLSSSPKRKRLSWVCMLAPLICCQQFLCSLLFMHQKALLGVHIGSLICCQQFLCSVLLCIKRLSWGACWLLSFVANNFYAHFYYASEGSLGCACWLLSFVANNFFAHFYYASEGSHGCACWLLSVVANNFYAHFYYASKGSHECACWLLSFVANNFYAHFYYASKGTHVGSFHLLPTIFYAHFYYASNGQWMFHDVPHVIILMMQVLMIDIPFWA